MRRLLLPFFICLAAPAAADDINIEAIVNNHVIAGYQTLASDTARLAETAAEDCAPASPSLVQTFHDAFDAWVGVSHLRFGPSEVDDQAFALAFWPYPRGSTPKALSALLQDEDPAVASSDEFATVSIAARGFYALEFLLFDPQFTNSDNPAYHCALVRAVTKDIASSADAILFDWQGGYGELMSNSGNNTYRTHNEAAKQLFTALTTGLEFTAQTRLGRPMGSFDRPRPNRAEARRSKRSLKHVVLSLVATRDLARLIAGDNAQVEDAFDTAIQRAKEMDDPVFAGVGDPQGRLRVEVLQQDIDTIRTILASEVGPALGIAAGFNSLDGD